MKLTDISELGEFALIKRLTEKTKIHHKETIKGIGDDAAVIQQNNKTTLISSDLLIEGVHFNLAYAPLKHLGYKSVVVNLSDIFAMNATPKQILVNIGVSSRFPAEALDELYAGIHKACEIYNVDLIGGDTSSSQKGLIISVTAIGEGDKDKVVYRNTANEKDLICVSGDLGGAYAGLRVLERENEVFQKNPEIQPDLSPYRYITERQLKPEARGDVIKKLKEHNVIPTSMIDVSDGLSSELMHICKNSNKGCYIYEEKIPIADETKVFAEETLIPSTIFALNGGEDYELLFTIKQKDYDIVKNMPEISVIGHIEAPEKGLYLCTPDNKEIPLEAQGWNTFDKPKDTEQKS